MPTRKICIATGARAEYGHMQWLARDIADDPRLTLQLLATGMHLEPRFGMTCREIEEDGFTIDARAPMTEDGDSALSVARSLGRGVIAIAEALDALAPDILVILGDRYEMLSAASAALILGVPIAHLHGGETTEGAFDEAIRHSITKMAALHFVAAAPYARRVIQLGEDPARVFLVGTAGLDALDRVQPVGRAELEAAIGLPLRDPVFLVTYHPATLSPTPVAEAIEALLAALEDFPQATVVFTGTNADTGHAAVTRATAGFVGRHRDRAVAVPSLGHRRYLSMLRLAVAAIGNSSSGLIEAPAVGTPTVNVGSRQQGRLRAASVIDCPERRDAIAAAIARALSPGFRASLAGTAPPYGAGGASSRIRDALATVELGGLRLKAFHDLAVPA